MKSKLPNADELSIKYIYNELDPSEEKMVEQAMASDEDMLIEVESLRRTMKRCESLPAYSAPGYVVDAVMQEAETWQSKRSRGRFLGGMRRYTYAAAAGILITGGSLWYVQGMQQAVTGTDNADASAIIIESPAKPWTDNRDVLHINAAGIGTASIADSSVKKLRPLDEEPSANRPARQIHLTGAQN